MRRAHANPCACIAAIAASLTLAACGGGERRDAAATDATYPVDVERVSFPAKQHLAQRTPLVISVRNAGDATIPNLTLVVRGFTDRSGAAADADRSRDVWIVDSGPADARTAFEDTWTAGPVKPGDVATLRWQLTPVVTGSHDITYEIAPAVAGPARAELENGGRPKGSLTVQVTDKPADARVDPATGEVQRSE